MKYYNEYRLKDGRTCIVRNGTEADAAGVLNNFNVTHGQTEFLTTYEDELTFTIEQERAYLKQKTESEREAELVAEVDGVIAGTAGVSLPRNAEKTRHRAGYGISIEKSWWGIGIGRALTESAIECARTAGYLQMELEVVADNARAIALYKKAGFAEYGRNPRGFRTRDGRWQENVLMRLELD
ncbi:MAG: GNAT family N-acetyltransferase [Clostridia bacterium]|nr:GNAT family N-acetyltransferase [Clostridia bacterium]